MINIISHTITIGRPVSEVYTYMINHENYKNWYPGVISITPLDDLPAGTPGKKYREKIKISKSRNAEFIVEVKDAATNNYYALEADWKPLMTRMEVSFESVSESETQVSWQFLSRSRSIWVSLLIKLIIKRQVEKQSRKAFLTLKKILGS